MSDNVKISIIEKNENINVVVKENVNSVNVVVKESEPVKVNITEIPRLLTPVVPKPCVPATYIVKYQDNTFIESGTIPSGGTKTIQVPNPTGGTYNVTFTFDNNLITILEVDDDESYNIDCSTGLDIAIVSGDVRFDGTYVANGTENTRTRYLHETNLDLRIRVGTGNVWQIVHNSLGIISQVSPTGQDYPWEADWDAQVEMSQGTISDYCGGGVCADATVENSDATYTDTVISGGTLVLPDTTYNIYVNGVLDQSFSVPTLKNETINIYP